MKKKIGIVTFHNAHNYGAVLQVFALQNVLKEENDVEVINYRNREVEAIYKIFRINKKNIFTICKSLFGDFIYYRKDKKRYKSFNEFINNNLNLSKEYKNEKQLLDNPPKLDIYITGSDQVWNYSIAKNVNIYTLNFGGEDVKRISYAASIGEETFYSDYLEQYKNNISKLDAISVREKSAQTYIQKLINKEVALTLDPTLLIKKEEWDKYIIDKKEKNEKYIFAYIVEDNEECFKILNYLSGITGYKVIYAGRRNKNIKNILENAYSRGPLDFISLIKNAEYVIATSFHATVFSILYHKKFWIIPHIKTGGRVTSLLETLEIRNRAVDSLDEFKTKKYDEKIDYEKVDIILEKERQKSKKWLKNAID